MFRLFQPNFGMFRFFRPSFGILVKKCPTLLDPVQICFEFFEQKWVCFCYLNFIDKKVQILFNRTQTCFNRCDLKLSEFCLYQLKKKTFPSSLVVRMYVCMYALVNLGVGWGVWGWIPVLQAFDPGRPFTNILRYQFLDYRPNNFSSINLI